MTKRLQKNSWRKCRKGDCKWKTRCDKSSQNTLPHRTQKREDPGIIALVVEWIPLKDMIKLYELSSTASGVFKEWLDDRIQKCVPASAFKGNLSPLVYVTTRAVRMGLLCPLHGSALIFDVSPKTTSAWFVWTVSTPPKKWTSCKSTKIVSCPNISWLAYRPARFDRDRYFRPGCLSRRDGASEAPLHPSAAEASRCAAAPAGVSGLLHLCSMSSFCFFVGLGACVGLALPKLRVRLATCHAARFR